MQEKPFLKKSTIALMIATAIFFDAMQWLLAFILMDWLAGFFAFMTFYLWFKLHGMSFATPKRAGTMATALIIEMIPVISAIAPTWTGAVIILILDTKIKKVASHVPGGNIALATAGNKVIHDRNMRQVNGMERLKPMSGNPEEIRAESRKRSAELNAKTEHFGKERERINKAREDFKQRQRKSEEDYGGYKKYDKDLSEIKYKYNDHNYKKPGSFPERGA